VAARLRIDPGFGLFTVLAPSQTRERLIRLYTSKAYRLDFLAMLKIPLDLVRCMCQKI